jgi:hypothetical protein
MLHGRLDGCYHCIRAWWDLANSRFIRFALWMQYRNPPRAQDEAVVWFVLEAQTSTSLCLSGTGA